MTIETTASSIAYEGNAATTTWSYDFLIPSQDNLVVTITDSDGNETELLTSEYSVTGIDDPDGGIVTYPLTGSPLALEEFITIARDMPLTQTVELSNQGGYYPETVEDGLDRLEMQIQQLSGSFSRALVAPLSDPAANLTIPNATARAGFYLAFDADGDPIAGTPVSGATVSSVMVPVVEAATLAASRTAYGLGNIATLNVGTGLVSSGGTLFAGNAVTADAISAAVTSAFNGTQRIATGPITYTLARANTLFNGFVFYVFALTGAITFTPNAADAIGNLSAGTSLIIQPGTWARITTNAAASGIWYIDTHFIGCPVPGGSLMLGGYIAQSRAASAETIEIKTLSGNDPSSMEPVICLFRSVTPGSGIFTARPVTSAVSLVINNTATMGFTNSVAGRLWYGLLDNAGTVELFAINCKVSTTSIYPLQAQGIITTTAMTVASDTAGVPYSASARTSLAYSTIGYATWETGLAAVGVWDTAPTVIQLWTGGSLPNSMINRAFATKTDTSTVAVTSGTYADMTNMTVSITVLSAANCVELEFVISACSTTVNSSVFLRALRGATALLVGDAASNRTRSATSGTVAAVGQTPFALAYGIIDFTPGTGTVVYKLQFTGDRTENYFINRGATDTDSSSFTRTASYIRATEIMA